MAWFVRAQEFKDEHLGEYSQYVNVFGPFRSETDARAYAIDLDLDNGWDTITPLQCDAHFAQEMASDNNIIDPYNTTA